MLIIYGLGFPKSDLILRGSITSVILKCHAKPCRVSKKIVSVTELPWFCFCILQTQW